MLKDAKKIISVIFLHAVAVASPAVALAQTSELAPADLTNTFDIVAVIQAAIRFIIIVAFVLAFIFLIIGGIRWIVAGGDEKGVAGARGMITAALIGLVIVLVSYAIIKLVETFFGVNIITGTVNIPKIGPQNPNRGL